MDNHNIKSIIIITAIPASLCARCSVSVSEFLRMDVTKKRKQRGKLGRRDVVTQLASQAWTARQMTATVRALSVLTYKALHHAEIRESNLTVVKTRRTLPTVRLGRPDRQATTDVNL
jgi:hypothetical protein